MSRHIYTVFDQHCCGKQRAIGELAFEQTDTRGVTQAQFRYLADYLKQTQARSIDPVNLPLNNEVFNFTQLPGALNDVLPDRWGREVALKLNNITRNNISGLIDWVSEHHIGSLSFAKRGQQPAKRAIGPSMNALTRLDTESNKFEETATPLIADEWAITLASGASVGGARRKTLVSEGQNGYLVKFSQKTDRINLPRVEHATMTLAEKAGIPVADTQIKQVNNKDALVVTRFDIVKGLPCKQILSFDTLLNGQASHYGELAQIIIKQVSTSRLEACLKQLFQQMCFNICINNTDDHLKNFSLLRNEKGWHISPAYDLVPSTSVGEYHQLGFDNSATPPKGKALIQYAERYFHLNGKKSRQIIDACEKEIAEWQQHFSDTGVTEKDINYLENVITARL
ncbi:MAG: type II toxin-antitoxin system HipA family toxin [Gammaproteobacteria bacterium]|nr:type II toxin-antitoxin system HipA family toxin [Gammaproteobacteria bacterium]